MIACVKNEASMQSSITPFFRIAKLDPVKILLGLGEI
jgi:hypothetical protein